MRLTFLGTGTSFGVPQIGCDCAVCRSTDPRDKRTRSGAVLEASGATILIDTPPGKAMLAFNGLAAADLIVIPASAERMAVDGVADLITHVQKIMWNKFALTHQELRILFTMYRATTCSQPYGSRALPAYAM